MDKIQEKRSRISRSINKFNGLSLSEKAITISFSFFVFLLIETILGNSGAWLSFGPVRLRMIIFALCFVTAVPKMIEKLLILLKNRFILSCIVFGLWILIAVYIGLKNGNNTEYIVSNVTGYLTIGLAPAIILYVDTFKKSHNVELLTTVLINTSLILAIMVSIIHFVIPFFTHKEIMEFSEQLNNISFGGFSFVSGGMYRIFLRSEIYFQIAIIVAISRELTKEKISWVNGFVISLLAFGMLLSLTRSFWIGALVGLVFLIYFRRKDLRKVLKLAIVSLSLLSMLIVTSMIIYRGNSIILVAMNRIESGLDVPSEEIPSPSNPDNISDGIRTEIFTSLIKRISESALIGNGMGAEIEKNSEGGNTEYLYLDLTMKLGIVGLLLFFLMYIELFLVFMKNRRRLRSEKPSYSDGYICALISVMVSSFFNPYLNNPIGLVFFLCVALILYSENERIQKSI